jgi:hypothetical protein
MAFDLTIRLISEVFHEVDLVLLRVLYDVERACELIITDFLLTYWPLAGQFELLLLLSTDVSIF